MESNLRYIFERLNDTFVPVLAIAGALLSVIGAFRAGIFKKIVLGPISFEASPKEVSEAKAIIEVVTTPTEAIPFETEQLARYYAQVLAQSKISFWFSLVFASLGFFVIVSSALMYADSRLGSTVASFTAGVIMDAVAALFFVQSKNAQTSMSQFFDKLRRDRQQAESRKILESVSNDAAKDALRIQLALHYAEVEGSREIAKSIVDSCLQQNNNVPRA
ncbi:MAG: TRADD-N-associated membrane domain-containing protein [Pyrinomonadaceae bacterium]